MADRAAGVAGLVGVVLNVAAVAALRPVPHTYAPGNVAAWWAESVAAPSATWASAMCFTFGLVALAAFAAGVARAFPAGTVAMTLFGGGALLDAAGTMLPVVALETGAELGQAFLRVTLYLDATFNGCIAAGLIAFAFVREVPRGRRVLALVAGLASAPVVLQSRFDEAARLLAIAGPLWLAWVMWMSLGLWRGQRA